jgi:hypothetical protein
MNGRETRKVLTAVDPEGSMDSGASMESGGSEN